MSEERRFLPATYTSHRGPISTLPVSPDSSSYLRARSSWCFAVAMHSRSLLLSFLKVSSFPWYFLRVHRAADSGFLPCYPLTGPLLVRFSFHFVPILDISGPYRTWMMCRRYISDTGLHSCLRLLSLQSTFLYPSYTLFLCVSSPQ